MEVELFNLKFAVTKSNPKAFPEHLTKKLVADYPHVVTNLKLFWGTKDFSEFLSKTSLSDRHGRKGFPTAILSEFLSLQIIHDNMFPQFVKHDVWSMAHINF